MKALHSLLVPAVMVVILGALVAADRPRTVLRVDLNEFDQLNRAQKDEWLVETRQRERSELEAEVIRRFGNAKDDDERCDMAWLMGMYRMERGANELAQHIKLFDWRHQPERLAGESAWPVWPAVDALVKMGSGANSAVLKLLGTTDDQTAMQNGVSVLRGQGVHVAECILRKAIEDEVRDGSRRRKLIAALEELKYQSVHGVNPSYRPRPEAPTTKP